MVHLRDCMADSHRGAYEAYSGRAVWDPKNTNDILELLPGLLIEQAAIIKSLLTNSLSSWSSIALLTEMLSGTNI